MSADTPTPDDYHDLPDESTATITDSEADNQPPEQVTITLEKWEWQSLQNRRSVEWTNDREVSIEVDDDASLATTDRGDVVQVGLPPERFSELERNGATEFFAPSAAHIADNGVKVVIARVD